MQRRSLEGSYWSALWIAILALSPFIVVTTASIFLRPDVMKEFEAGTTGLDVVAGMSTAGYAFGALVGGDLVQRFAQRRLFFLCEALFVTGSPALV